MKVVLVLAATLHLLLAASIVDVLCPDSCSCQVKDQNLEAWCSSYEFIKKLIPKQVSKIVTLNINNASLSNVDSKLKYLKKLNHLDLSDNSIANLPSQFPYLPKLNTLNLSNNHLNTIVFNQLPKNIEIIDLSRNSIQEFPKDWSSLKRLKSLDLKGNPIDCDCNNLLIYEQITNEGIKISKDLTCHYPKELYGKVITSINCTLVKENLLNSMLGDDAGSGGLEDFGSPTKEEEEFINAENVHEKSEDFIEEGSGDEGSGEILPILPLVPISIPEPKACHFNCSTPKPIGLHDEKNASPLPPLKEQGLMLFEDILQPDKVDVVTSVPNVELKEVAEETIVKETDKEVESIPTNDTVIGEMERASIQGSNNHSVYIVVGLLIAFMTFLIIYFANKKRNQRQRKMMRKRNKSNENGFGEEMKPLGKSAEKPVETINAKPEITPLLNGQNGKLTEEKNENDLENVELRKNDKQELLTPQLERVTIKAAEIPDSIPKTPLLVHRSLNSDGEIVTTALNSN